MDIFMYGMFLLPLAVFVPIYVAEKAGAPNWYLILTSALFVFVLTSFWRWVNEVSIEHVSLPALWTVNVLVSMAALALFYIVKSLRPREVCTLPPQAGYYTSTNYTMNTEKESLDDEDSAVPRLTEEQAAIIMAFTGISCGPFELFHKYAQEKLGRHIWTHNFAKEELMAEIKEASRDDFLSICCLKKYDNE